MRFLRALWARLAVIAIGRRNPLTLTEHRRQAWGGMPKAFHQTQPGRITRLSEWRALHEQTRRRA